MDSFRELIKKEMSDDNLDFWQAVEAFRKMKRRSGPFLAAAKDIYLSYIKTKRIGCLTATIKNRIRRIYTAPGKIIPTELFHQAQELVFDTMFKGVYMRFIDSKEGQR